MATRRYRQIVLAAVAILTLAGVLFAAPEAMANHEPPACGDRAEVLAYLHDDWGEVPVAIGKSGETVIELIVGPDGKTWSLVQTTAAGRSCLVGEGEDWTVIAPIPLSGDPA